MKSKFFSLITLVSFSLSPLAFTAETEKTIISLEDFQRHLAELSVEEEEFVAETEASSIPSVKEEEQKVIAEAEEIPLPEVTPLEESQVIDPLLDAPDTYQIDAEFIEEPEEPVIPYEVQPAPKKGLSVAQTRTRQNILLALIGVAVAVIAIVLVGKNQGCEAHKDHDNH